MTILELKEGCAVTGMHALIVDKKIATTKAGKTYADLVLRDKTGEIKAKLWDYHSSLDQVTAVNKTIIFSATVSRYNNELQATLGSPINQSDRPVMDFAKTTRLDVNKLWKDIEDAISEITEPLPKYILTELMVPWQNNFKKAPAAKGVHNAWYGGVLEHTWNMLKIAKQIATHYKETYQAKFSIDKIVFGVIIHDFCKIFEYNFETPSYQMEGDGVLANHIVLGPAQIYEQANNWWPQEVRAQVEDKQRQKMTMTEFLRERAHLMHLVASHHGQLDFGSPIVPATLEAVILHQVDMIDAKFMHALELVEGKEGQVKDFSEKSWTEKTSYLQYK